MLMSITLPAPLLCPDQTLNASNVSYSFSFLFRVSIKGLDTFSEGKPLSLVVTPSDGGAPFEITVNHTFNSEQIDWFKAGSALNLMKQTNSA